MHSLRLPLTFSAEELQIDLERVQPDEWTRHYEDDDYEGEWSGAPLRSIGGQMGQLFPIPAAHILFEDTPLLARCPYFREVLSSIACPLNSVRLLRLESGSRILAHSDDGLGIEAGEVRLHIPIVTEAGVEFYLDEQRVEMSAGECWYLDLSRTHRCDNNSTSPRVHLVVDCVVNDWIRDLACDATR